MTLAKTRLSLMGTQIDVMITGKYSDEVLKETCRQLRYYAQRFSPYDKHSELTTIHNKAYQSPLTIAPDLFDLITIGKQHSLAPQSQLNIAIGPLVNVWRIGFSDAHLPTHDSIKKALLNSQASDILLDSNTSTISLNRPNMSLDLGAIAKGYIADQLMAFLKKEQVTSAMLNLGGNVLAHGPNPNHPSGFWFIGIQDPKADRGQHLLTLPIKNLSIVTSGIYERQFKDGDKSYHHLLDKQTGFPIDSDMASLTIISPQSFEADIWSTRLFGLPIATALNYINQHQQLEGIIIDKDNQLYLSNRLKSYQKSSRRLV
ncbi:FAD:protein FMN transferase [Streptococcus sp. sy018]|uniref:FAD:protein FMN transferase n=1 Tax=Streptococcus sp. sy018 TaxID=2600147 RepID=UPI0011B5AE3F|nr:FAD:protein FMN transferase [Streptococcus sp. sy018]TWS95591.1 FAD:protein FMN transferase [Streptococcus sp. sy018]